MKKLSEHINEKLDNVNTNFDSVDEGAERKTIKALHIKAQDAMAEFIALLIEKKQNGMITTGVVEILKNAIPEQSRRDIIYSKWE